MEKNKEVKDMSIYEASDFWDEHDFSEFNDVVEVKDMRFSLSKKKLCSLTGISGKPKSLRTALKFSCPSTKFSIIT